MIDLTKLTVPQRRAWLLLRSYEEERRKTQTGYRLFQVLNASIIPDPKFKTLVTVTEWLIKEGWPPSWDDVHWKGYVRHVFKFFAPSVPMPGQLKNKRLLREYIAAAPDREVPPKRTREEMAAIYDKVLDPFFKNVSLGLHD